MLGTFAPVAIRNLVIALALVSCCGANADPTYLPDPIATQRNLDWETQLILQLTGTSTIPGGIVSMMPQWKDLADFSIRVDQTDTVVSLGAGADPSGQVAADTYFSKAVSDLLTLRRNNSKKVLTFYIPPGSYSLDCTSSPCLNLSGLDNLLILGNNSMVVSRNPRATLLKLSGNNGIRLYNLRFTYSPLPFISGRVQTVSQGEIQLGVSGSGYLTNVCQFSASPSCAPTDEINDSIRWSCVADSNLGGTKVRAIAAGARLPKGNQISVTKLCQQTGTSHWKIVFDCNSNYWNSEIKKIVPNFDVITVAARSANSAFDVAAVHNSNFSFVQLHSSPSLGIQIRNSGNFELRNVDVIPDYSNQVFSTNADALHIRNPDGPVSIESSLFSDNGDDLMNFYSTGVNILSLVEDCPAGSSKFSSPATSAVPVTLSAADPLDQVQEGNSFQIVDANSGIILFEGTIPVGSIQCRYTTPKGTSRLKVYLGIPAGTSFGSTGRLFSWNSNASLRIHNSIFGTSIGRSLVVRGISHEISQNVFIGAIHSGVVVGFDLGSFLEGPIPKAGSIDSNFFLSAPGAGAYVRGLFRLVDGGTYDALPIPSEPYYIQNNRFSQDQGTKVDFSSDYPFLNSILNKNTH